MTNLFSRSTRLLCQALVAAATALGSSQTQAISLADAPMFSTTTVPGNLALPLSVEFPTAVSVAHIGSTYSSGTNYVGYFDPAKCYFFKFVDVETSTLMSHFAPAGAATSRTCTGTLDHLWSGNYLNWATMQTIDPFRWALTGGYRVVDTASLTLLEKAWASGQGGTGNFPDRSLSVAADIANATPFKDTGLTAYVQGRGNQANFVMASAFGTGGFLATYFKGTNWDYGGNTPVLTRTESINFANWGGSNSPDTTVFASGEAFSVRWVSSSTVPTTGSYQFRVLSDDGISVWVNGTQVINQASWSSTATTSAAISLTAGQPLNVRVEYWQGGGPGNATLSWMAPGATVYSVYQGGNGGYLYLPIRAKVCDPSTAAGGLENNCVAYSGGNYKPEGLIQKYASTLRYSVFGYLNDSNIQRDAGVLRAKQKFVGPTYPVPGSTAASNAAAEWDATTGVYNLNPDTTDASNTSTLVGTTISNSGVLNYLNKFGEINRGNYKSYDPVGELYYAALRYYKNQGNVPEWSSMAGTSDPNVKVAWADGFPVITTWNDPILYRCQRNFILGIGDVNTHADKNVPGPTGTANEPTKPYSSGGSNLMNDSTYNASYNAYTATNKVGVLQGMGASLGSAENIGGCCNNNSALMAGLAYDANTRDIRSDLENMPETVGQTVQTFWLDVLEYQTYKSNNQFYLAAKYGGFNAPSTFDPYSSTAALQDGWWYTSTDTVGGQPRPDNYFVASSPDTMVAGLTKAFAKIVKTTQEARGTALAFINPNETTSGSINYAAGYNPDDWTGRLTGSTVAYGTDGTPTLTQAWEARDLLTAMTSADRKIVTCCTSAGAGLAFTNAALTAATLSSRTYFTSFATVPGVASGSQSAANFVAYLRGDRTKEVSGGGAYRNRKSLLGDIVNSKVTAVGPPNATYYDDTNPGYSTFVRTYAARTKVVYAGANDGMLHAFNGTTGGTDSGKELFAYIPSFVYGDASTYSTSGIAALGNPGYSHRYFVDATPNVFDVDFNRAGTATAATTSDWRSLLIGGLGKGGKGYYAIDVTNPGDWTTETAVAGKVLWEFTDSTMGYSYGDAQMVKTAKYGWTLLLASGYNNADGKGYIYFVNPKTGALLEKVATPTGSVGAPINLAHLTAFLPDQTNYTATALYGGDLQGNIWRVDLTGTSGSYSAPLAIATLTDAGGTVQPVTTPVRVMIDPTTKKRYVMVGTGRLLDDSDAASTQIQTFYALIDGTTTDFYIASTLPTGVTFPVPRSKLNANTDLTVGIGSSPAQPMGWYHDLGASASGVAERVTVMSAPSDGVIGVGVNLPGGDVCIPEGKSYVIAVGYATGKSVLVNTSGNVIAGTALVSGVVTDIAFKNIRGRKRLYAGRSTGDVSNLPGTFTSGGSLKRLNWREVPTLN